MKKNLNFSLLSFFWLLACFALHRIFTFGFLFEVDSQISFWQISNIFFVGFLSDIWIATLGGLIFYLLGAILFYLPRLAKFLQMTYLLLIALFVLLHQSYVEFFGFQIIPNHLKYFVDFDFIEANSDTAINFKAIVTLALATMLTTFVYFFFRTRRVSLKVSCILATGLLVIGLASHAANIRYRVQWFVPEKLQTNFFEKLYLNSKIARDPLSPEPQKLSILLEMLGKPSASTDKEALYRDLVYWRVGQTEVSKLGQSLKTVFDKRLQAGRKPLVIIVLLESARPAEFASYSKEATESLTPQFDALVKAGLLFNNAFSTGSVTRGAQEAAFCGYLGSQNTSMMRERNEVRLSCLPEILASSAESFWFHGGRGEFDGQRLFWQSHGVEHLLSDKDFDENAPITGWGVSDQAMFERVVRDLKSLREQSRKTFIFGEVLTVTNHIPWRLPSDANLPEPIRDKLKKKHRSYLTTAYTDQALGRFIADLKAADLWDDSIIFALGDHGIAAPAFHKDTEPRQNKSARFLSHITFGMFGGIVANATKNLQPEDRLIPAFVSQADIAPFVAYLAGSYDQSFFAENLFAEKRKSPVVADLGDSTYFPQMELQLTRSELLTKKSFDDATHENAVLYYRAFLLHLNHLGLKQAK